MNIGPMAIIYKTVTKLVTGVKKGQNEVQLLLIKLNNVLKFTKLYNCFKVRKKLFAALGTIQFYILHTCCGL